ncbi:MAG TPA: hypothetical protein VJB12_05930 [Candidatus Nanoarchaeia archaeon]|nr:hypothetical protein [Candidatus Nanoarchaeia archaeon]
MAPLSSVISASRPKPVLYNDEPLYNLKILWKFEWGQGSLSERVGPYADKIAPFANQAVEDLERRAERCANDLFSMRQWWASIDGYLHEGTISGIRSREATYEIRNAMEAINLHFCFWHGLAEEYGLSNSLSFKDPHPDDPSFPNDSLSGPQYNEDLVTDGRVLFLLNQRNSYLFSIGQKVLSPKSQDVVPEHLKAKREKWGAMEFK